MEVLQGVLQWEQLDEMKSLAADLDSIYEVSAGRMAIDDQISSKGSTAIILGSRNRTFGSGDILYDLSGSQLVEGVSPFVGLSHEIGHSRDIEYGVQIPRSNKDYGTATPPWEVNAVRLENAVRSHYGFPVRGEYGVTSLFPFVVTP